MLHAYIVCICIYIYGERKRDLPVISMIIIMSKMKISLLPGLY